MVPAIPDQRAGELDESEVVLCLFVIAHKDCTALAQPRQGTFHHPATGWMALLLVFIELLFADPANMRRVVVLGNSLVPGRIVEAFVQTQVLRRLLRGLGTLDDHSLDGIIQQFRVMGVGSAHHDSQRATRPFD